MVAFPLDADLTHPLDYLLLQNGPLSLTCSAIDTELFCRALSRLGYTSISIDAGQWTSAKDLHAGVAAALQFPDYYGANTAALRDCLYDVAKGDYGWSAHATGLVVSVTHLSYVLERDPATVQLLADAAIDQGRVGMLFGHRVVWLLDVGDRSRQLPSIGGAVPPWADVRWLT